MEEENSSLEGASEAAQRDRVIERLPLSAPRVYQVVQLEGESELRRPLRSLFFSGVAAGLAIGASVHGKALLHGASAGTPWDTVFSSLGYTIGFLIVVLGRLQLFTENTITAILPLLKTPSVAMLLATGRLWAIVFAANMVGTFGYAVATVTLGVSSVEHVDAIAAISHHLLELSPGETFAHGIPAGFLIAALVWMLPTSEGSEGLVIIVLTYLISLGGFTHVIAGSAEIFVLMLRGDVGFFDAALFHIAPALGGNIVGGTGLFTLLAYGQVADEIE